MCCSNSFLNAHRWGGRVRAHLPLFTRQIKNYVLAINVFVNLQVKMLGLLTTDYGYRNKLSLLQQLIECSDVLLGPHWLYG